MRTTHRTSQASTTRECCIHEAIHSRKMEGIHTGVIGSANGPGRSTLDRQPRRLTERAPASQPGD